ncbi:DNA repr REX1B domain containing protein isoform 3 [Scophthalmus maximus]|uniref:DNA repr REX1B domain containing protein isoform 3 n=1 Tax=Scophthalmus maximus TaxID=52904 RepID=A0A2U9C398_SCOMX|nr:DNA repr REX1B domain containing protein isoform 3 [Scophthalmus maximus]
MVPTDFKDLIQRFYLLQSERVETYRLFEEGHEAYLRTGPHYDFDHYRQLVHEITLAFCGISEEVLQIKGRLHGDFDRPELCEHIEKLQSKEKQKLELVRKRSLCLTRS